MNDSIEMRSEAKHFERYGGNKPSSNKNHNFDSSQLNPSISKFYIAVSNIIWTHSGIHACIWAFTCQKTIK